MAETDNQVELQFLRELALRQIEAGHATILRRLQRGGLSQIFRHISPVGLAVLRVTCKRFYEIFLSLDLKVKIRDWYTCEGKKEMCLDENHGNECLESMSFLLREWMGDAGLTFMGGVFRFKRVKDTVKVGIKRLKRELGDDYLPIVKPGNGQESCREEGKEELWDGSSGFGIRRRRLGINTIFRPEWRILTVIYLWVLPIPAVSRIFTVAPRLSPFSHCHLLIECC
ncbi:hypothetical protein B0J14DRAFT_568647 [Halenospora varia]|nr:hypothetical protein B0J14DRAFT_568647 [Halenospora varia]